MAWSCANWDFSALFLLLGLNPCWDYGKNSSTPSWVRLSKCDIFSCGGAGPSHLSRDACPLQEWHPATCRFCMGLGGWAGLQPVLEWPGEVISVLGEGCQLAPAHPCFPCHCHPPTRRGLEQPGIVAGDALFVWVWHSVLSPVGRGGCEREKRWYVVSDWKKENYEAFPWVSQMTCPGSAGFWSWSPAATSSRVTFLLRSGLNLFPLKVEK